MVLRAGEKRRVLCARAHSRFARSVETTSFVFSSSAAAAEFNAERSQTLFRMRKGERKALRRLSPLQQRSHRPSFASNAKEKSS